MSADIVNDLHAAEDRIGQLEAALELIVSGLEGWDDIVLVGSGYTSGTYLCEEARALLAERYERPTREREDL